MNRIPVIDTLMPAPSLHRRRVQEGRPFPLGATWDGLGVNFALFSANATKVELCLFEIEGNQELERIELPEYTDEVWHGYLPDARPGQVDGYRSMDRTLLPKGTASTTTSFCSTPTASRSWAN
jgi:isoamylase